MQKLIMSLMLCLPIWCHALSDKNFFELRRKIRRKESQTVKSYVMEFDAKKKLPKQAENGDQSRYRDFRGNFGKALLHLQTGFINPDAFESLVFALDSGNNKDFKHIILGTGVVKLTNPQASLAFSLAANDGWINAIPAAPEFASAQTAGEMVELYWTVLVRDIPFSAFSSSATVASAVDDLNTLTAFRGPKVGGLVTAETFLRGNTEGDLIGPYVSQFLLQKIPYGTQTLHPEIEVPLPGNGNDFLTNFAHWFTVINGGLTGEQITFDPTPQFIRTPRDLGEYVRKDFPGQPFYQAALLLNSYGSLALDPNNPYLENATQVGFVTYGLGQVLELVAEAVEEGLKAAWFQKWQVHRRLRPEEYGFYVQKQVDEGQTLRINSELTNSPVLPMIFNIFGSYFLPQAYPEGSPTHPSYPAGHAVAAGAAATVLKAFYAEEFEIPNPLSPNADSTALVPYNGTLKVGDELNKLASNISLGRDHAGVHYRSDGYNGLLLGEQVAIDLINNCSFLNNEKFKGFSLTQFNGKKITVGKKRTSL